MAMKRYIWGFPGAGKSSLDVPGLRVVDADCNLFIFKNASLADLHVEARHKQFERSCSYPENYLEYIRNVDADIVLLNCHVGLLEPLGKDNVLVVYPDVNLIPEYLERYRDRGDNDSFVSYMEDEAVGIIFFIEASGFERYRIGTAGIYLQDLFEREDFKMKLMTRKELTEQLQRAITLNVVVATYQAGDNARLRFDAAYADMDIQDIQKSVHESAERMQGAAVLAEKVLDGKYQMDIGQLEKACLQREAVLKSEREELISHFQRAIDLNVLDTYAHNNTIVCDLSFAQDGTNCADFYDAYDLAEDVMNGKLEVDIENLLDVCMQREIQIEEMKLADLRGGLSREELADKIMEGIVNGALGIEYDQIAPYSHGYEVTFGGQGPVGSTRDFKNRWECYRCDFFEVPERIVSMIEKEQQDGRVFGKGTRPLDIREMLQAIEDMEAKKITSFTPEKETNFERWGTRGYGSRGSIATVMDVHAGKGLDGIVQHHYHGDYSSMTPSRQNSLVETLVFMKGFCLDYLDKIDGGAVARNKVIDYLKKHGTDISSPEKMRAWIRENPEKCGREDNRVVKQLDDEMYARAYSDFIELKALVDAYTESLEEFCDSQELLGDWYENVFECTYGVLDLRIVEKEDGSFYIDDKNIGIWDNVNDILEEDISIDWLKEKCEKIGLDEQILNAEGKKKEPGKGLGAREFERE